jgi:hypothetical protein
MMDVKLPEPAGVGYLLHYSVGDSVSTLREGHASVLGTNVYTASQVREILETAIKVCAVEAANWKSPKFSFASAAATHCAGHIRKLQEQIK